MDKPRVVLTGATGFVGRSSVPALRRRGYEVHAVTSRPPGYAIDPPVDAVLHSVDLFDPPAVAALFAEVQPSHLLHFAWVATPGLFWSSPENFRWVAASLQLLRAFHAAGGRRVVMAGSCAEYDWGCADICREAETPLATDGAKIATVYATCKIALQKMLAAYGREEGLSTAWGRIFSPFGPHEHPARLVASVVHNLIAGKPALCSAGTQVRNFIYSSEAGSAFAALLDGTAEGVVNIGTEERGTIADLVGEIGALMARPDLLRLGARPMAGNEPAVLVPDVRRLYDDVGWRPTITKTEGLRKTISWWQSRLAKP